MTVFDTNKILYAADGVGALMKDDTPTGTLLITINGTTRDANNDLHWPFTLAAVNGLGDLIFRKPALRLPIQYDDKGLAANRPSAGNPLDLTFNVHGDDGQAAGTPTPITLTINPVAAGTVPAAFGAGDWALNDVPSVGGDKLEIDVTALPSDGGSAITALNYQVDSGSGFGAVKALAGTGTGKRTITVLAGTAANVRLWATNAIGDGDRTAAGANKSQTPSIIGGGAEPAAHTTVADNAALGTLLTQLDSNYDITVAANGGTAGQEFYIDCVAGAYSLGTFSNRTFAHMVHVRAQDRAGGCTTNKGTISNAHNLRLAFFEVVNAAATQSTLNVQGGSTDVTLSHLRVLGHPTYGQKTGGTGVKHGIDLRGDQGGRMSNIRVEYCDIQRAGQNAIRGLRIDGLAIVACIFDENGADDWQIKDIDGFLIELNWGTTLNRAGATSHMDAGQMTKDAGTGIGCFNGIIRRNVVADWRLQNPDDVPYRMGWQCGDFPHQNITIRDNIVLTGNTHGANIQGGPYIVENNLFWRMNGTTNIHGTTHTAINGTSNGTFADNFEMIPAGSNTSPRPGSTNVDNTDAARAQYIGALRQGGDTWTIGGVGGDFSEMMPPVTSTLHWNHASKAGPWNRLREVFVDGLHPGNDDWPTRDAFNAGHNRHGRITS